jgi:hypothetical protein
MISQTHWKQGLCIVLFWGMFGSVSAQSATPPPSQNGPKPTPSKTMLNTNVDSDTTSPKNIERMDTVLVQSKTWKFKKKGLYDESLKADPENINGFYALQILDEDLGKDIWISLEPKCVKLEKISDESAHRGNHSFRLTWDKITGGCTWLGMGMGWDNWQPKDLSTVLDTAFLEPIL